MYHSFPRRRKSGVIVPFLLLVVIVLTVVFAFQIWTYFKNASEQKTENKAALEVVQGRAEMKLYGEDSWFPAPTGSILREGDALRTFPDTRISLTLLNGGFVRLDANSEMRVDSLRSFDGQDAMTVHLSYGDVWLKKTKSDDVKTSFAVLTDDFHIRAAGTLFAVHKRQDFRVYVMEGKVSVDVQEEVDGKKRTFETVSVGVGQQIILSDRDLQKMRERKAVDLLYALSDEFKSGDWYVWNAARDNAPQADSISVEQAVNNNDVKISLNVTPPVSELIDESRNFPSPEVTEPAPSKRQFSENRMVVRGTTSVKTKKMVVKTFVGGREDTYALQKYQPGSSSWLYLVSTDLANLVPGQNRYQIIAVDEDGKESPPKELLLYFEKAKTTSQLQAPKIVSFNDGTSNETSESSVKVMGTIGKGIVKVFVNDFALTKYVPDSGEWIYFAKTEYDNLKEGVNEYSTYGIDVDGRKTPVTKFTIKKVKGQR